MKKYRIPLAIAAVLGLVGIAYIWQRPSQLQPVDGGAVTVPNNTANPHSFSECVAYGYPVQETQPRKCQAGKIAFVDTEYVEPAPVRLPVVIDSLAPNSLFESPVTLRGKAVGTWFFEARFPVRVLDAQGGIIEHAYAQADSEWQTAEYVPFTVVITFPAPSTATGYVEFAKDNPSGLSDLDASVRIPVRFK